ncbi:ArnT family glycosyltransferase [Coraliomargarita sp. W4R53]
MAFLNFAPQIASERSACLWRRLSLFLLLLVALIGVVTVQDYGRSWDEFFRFRSGDAKLAYYHALFTDESPVALHDSYPGLFDLPLAWVHEHFPEWGTRSQKGHVWSLCFGLLGLLAAWRLTARIAGERAGFWALLLLTTLPRYYGHMFFNPKDIPLAATYTLGLWALVHVFAALPQAHKASGTWIGLTAGLALSTRIGGFLILVYFGAFIGLYLLIQYLKEGRDMARLKHELWAWGLRGVGAGLLALMVLFIFWPTLHNDPFAGATESASEVQSYGWDEAVLVDGNTYFASELPRSYLPYWMWRTIPEHVQLLFAVALICGVWQLMRRQHAWRRLLAPALLLFSVLFPLIYIAWSHPVLYDGMRHALFILPPLVCCAALGFEWCLRRLSRVRARCLQAVLGIAVGVTVLQMVSLHPYQYIYFNQITGGLQSAYLHDETDYWGLSHKEAAEWLNTNIHSDRKCTIHLKYSRYMLLEHVDPDKFELVPEPEGADFFVAITRFGFYDDYPDAELLHVVERQGVPLCFIFALSDEFKTKSD